MGFFKALAGVVNMICAGALLLFLLTGNLTVYCSRGLITNSLSCTARLNLP